MKSQFIVRFFGLFIVCALGLHAQDFEGTMKWKYKIQITGAPAAQAPAMDAVQLAQMKAMLADPQTRAMMEQNPQMKAMIEAQIKAVEGGANPATGMFPTGMTARVKGAQSQVVMEGGMMPMEILHLADGSSVTVDRKARTFSRLPAASKPAAAVVQPQTKVTKTAVTAKVLGYTCAKYQIEALEGGKTTSGSIWATKEIPGLTIAGLGGGRVAGGGDWDLSGIDGVPLRMEFVTPEGKMEIEAVSVERGAVPADALAVPAGFTERPFGAMR